MKYRKIMKGKVVRKEGGMSILSKFITKVNKK